MNAHAFEMGAIETLTDRNWTGSVSMENASVTLTTIPEIARIMEFSLRGYPNLIWQNPDLLGQLADPQQSQQGIWRNFGGAKLWVAPQSRWDAVFGNWPPEYELDAAPCDLHQIAPDHLTLQGQLSPTQGIQLRRQIQLVDQGADFIYTLSNRSDQTVSWGIWMVFQAIPGGKLFLPATDRTQFWLDPQFSIDGATEPEDLHFHKQDQVYVLDQARSIYKTKLFSIPDHGWLAYWVADQVFFLLYEAAPEAQYPAGEGSTEIFTDADYIELEHIGPLISIAPGESTSLPESWRILPAPDLSDPHQQITWVQAQAAALDPLRI